MLCAPLILVLSKPDLSVGLELDELNWPSTAVPRSMLLTSFYTLSLLASQDRFALQYALMQCIVNGRPWDCKVRLLHSLFRIANFHALKKPTTVLEELLWEPVKLPEPLDSYFPNARWWSSFWWDELDISNTGNNIFHNMVIQNTPIRCLQKVRLLSFQLHTFSLTSIPESFLCTQSGNKPHSMP